MATDDNRAFEQSPLWLDVKATIVSGPKPVYFDTSVEVHTKDNDFSVFKVLEIQEDCNYAMDFCGSMFIRFSMALGDYVYKLYPFRDTLEVSIKKTPQKDTGGTNEDMEVQVTRYRAILKLDGSNPSLTGKRISNQSYEALNQNQMVDIHLELIDLNADVLRVANIPGGAYRDATPQQLIAGIMTGESNKYRIGGEPAIKAFNMTKPDNTAVMPNPVLPSGLKLAQVPTFVQERMQGVYSSGLGVFYQRHAGIPSWFVYSLYNPTRFDDDVERAVIFAVPEDRMSGMDVTYRKEGKILYIAVTGQQQYSDDSKMSDLNNGVGFRMPSANALSNEPFELTPTGPVADRVRMNTEVGGRSRADGLYFAPMVKASTNPYKHYSRIAAQQLAQLQLSWQNAKPDLIYPGMPCKYVFMDDGEYREAKGIILGKYSVESLIGSSIASNSYRVETALGICLEYYSHTPTQPEAKSPGTF